MTRTSSSGFPARFSSENTERPIKFDLQLHMQYLGRTYNKKKKKPACLSEKFNWASCILSNHPVTYLTLPRFSEGPKHAKDWLGFWSY